MARFVVLTNTMGTPTGCLDQLTGNIVPMALCEQQRAGSRSGGLLVANGVKNKLIPFANKAQKSAYDTAMKRLKVQVPNLKAWLISRGYPIADGSDNVEIILKYLALSGIGKKYGFGPNELAELLTIFGSANENFDVGGLISGGMDLFGTIIGGIVDMAQGPPQPTPQEACSKDGGYWNGSECIQKVSATGTAGGGVALTPGGQGGSGSNMTGQGGGPQLPPRVGGSNNGNTVIYIVIAIAAAIGLYFLLGKKKGK